MCSDKETGLVGSSEEFDLSMLKGSSESVDSRDGVFLCVVWYKGVVNSVS